MTEIEPALAFVALPASCLRTDAQSTPGVGVLTVSDRASSGDYADRGGPAIQSYCQDVIDSRFQLVPVIVPDEQNQIESALENLVDIQRCSLVITTGGTGPARRDVTPEATAAVCQKMMPGFGELMRQVSLAKVPTAILSRQTAGIRYPAHDAQQPGALIVNLPGQPKAITECLDAVFPAIPYCVELIGGPMLQTNTSRFEAFRPRSAPLNPPAQS